MSVEKTAPTAVIERDLNRLMGYGIVKSYRVRRASNGRRVFVIDTGGDRPHRWAVGETYAFVTGAMTMAQALEGRAS